MLTFHTKVDHAANVDSELVLNLEMREKGHLQTRLASGEEVTIMSGQGTVLRNGDLLKADDGRVLRILAAKETTHRIECDTLRDLLRCAYHLGHHQTQVHIGNIGDYFYLRIRHDPALKAMLEDLGATVIDEHAAFEPEISAPLEDNYMRGSEHRHH